MALAGRCIELIADAYGKRLFVFGINQNQVARLLRTRNNGKTEEKNTKKPFIPKRPGFCIILYFLLIHMRRL